jgi:hypothetical protein
VLGITWDAPLAVLLRREWVKRPKATDDADRQAARGILREAAASVERVPLEDRDELHEFARIARYTLAMTLVCDLAAAAEDTDPLEWLTGWLAAPYSSKANTDARAPNASRKDRDGTAENDPTRARRS